MAEESIHPFAAAGNGQLVATTLLVNGLLVGMAVLFSVLAWKLRERGGVKYVLLAAAVLQLILVVVFANFKIRSYEIGPHRLVIRHGVSEAVYPLNALVGVRLQPEPFRGAIRCGGMGGVWSYLGRFSSPELGEFRAYVSDPRRAVLITFSDQQVVVSPENPDGFMATLMTSK